MIELAFHEAIRSGDPGATPVYADWLEENGRDAEARWLRSGRWRLIPAGTFWTGGGGGQAGTKQVSIPQAFYLGTYPVTQGEWAAVMGTNPSWFAREGGGKDKVQDIPGEELKQFPVESVTWADVQEFLGKLNKKERVSGYTYRLPSEAEWEYACRGGATSQVECAYHFYFANPTNDLSSGQANFHGDYPAGQGGKGPYLGRPTKVGSYAPNKLGLYDLHGNVWEWTDSLWEGGGSDRVIRGGSWNGHGGSCQAAYQDGFAPSGSSNLGFRLARVPVR